MEFKRLLTPWNWFKDEEQQKTVRAKNSMETVAGQHPLVRLQNEIDQLFHHFFQGFPLTRVGMNEGSLIGGQIIPQLNIAENRNNYTITIEVPGVEEDDIELTVEDGTLTIRGEKRYEHEQSDNQYHRVERAYGSFQRVLSLPTNANEDQIVAKFANGVLTVIVDKNPTNLPRGRKIAIN